MQNNSSDILDVWQKNDRFCILIKENRRKLPSEIIGNYLRKSSETFFKNTLFKKTHFFKIPLFSKYHFFKIPFFQNTTFFKNTLFSKYRFFKILFFQKHTFSKTILFLKNPLFSICADHTIILFRKKPFYCNHLAGIYP